MRVLALYETDGESVLVGQALVGHDRIDMCRIASLSRGHGRVVVSGGCALITVDRGPAVSPFVRLDLSSGAATDATPPVPATEPFGLGQCRAHPDGVLSFVSRPFRRAGELWLSDGGPWAREPLPPSFDVSDVAIHGGSIIAAGRELRRHPVGAVVERDGTGRWRSLVGRRVRHAPSAFHLVMHHGRAVAVWGTADDFESVDGMIVTGVLGGEVWHSVPLRPDVLSGVVATADGAVAVTSLGRAVSVTDGSSRAVPGLVTALSALDGGSASLLWVRGDGDYVVAIARSVVGGQSSQSTILASVDRGRTFDVVATARPGMPDPVDVALSP